MKQRESEGMEMDNTFNNLGKPRNMMTEVEVFQLTDYEVNHLTLESVTNIHEMVY